MTELREPENLDAAALDAAERAYWKDDGVSRHNLATAIQAYLGARPPEEPPPTFADNRGIIGALADVQDAGQRLATPAPLRGPSPCQHVEAIERALNELGVPQPDYPAPVVNAVEILRASLGWRGVSAPAPSGPTGESGATGALGPAGG